jgi:DNA-binding NarL/FixJ family response regulator
MRASQYSSAIFGEKHPAGHGAVRDRNTLLDAPSTAEAPPTVVIYGNQLYCDCLSSSISTAIGGKVSTFSCASAWLERQDPSDALVLVCTSGLSKEREAAELDALLSHPTPPRVVVVGDSEEPSDVFSILNKGARGYIPTSLVLNIAVEAIRLVCAGGIFFPANTILKAQQTPVTSEPKKERALESFTPKQMAVIEMIRKGKANKTIAYELNMCESTVKVHVRNIMKKLRARNRTQVAFFANQMLGDAPSF